VWFTESNIVLVIYFLLIVLFTHFILDIKKSVLYQVKQLNHILFKQQSLALPHSHRSHTRLLTGLLASVVRC
jgi:hypothetical protein